MPPSTSAIAAALLLLGCASLVEAFGEQCPATTFQSSTNATLCPNLVKQPNITTSDDCRSACCKSAACGVWEWCNNPGSGCSKWAGARCHLGPLPAAGTACPHQVHWIGESKDVRPQPPPPSPPHPPSPGPPSPPPGKPVTRKQGFSGFTGKTITCNDAHGASMGDTWYYTWMMNTAQYMRCDAMSQAAEFVPMVNGVGQLDDGVSSHYQKEWTTNNAHYLLGYNEPDFGNGHNHPHMVAPAAAAKDWVNVQKAAEQLGLALVSPAVSTTGLEDDGSSDWFDEFFGNCTEAVTPGCDTSKISYMAFHDYNGNVSRIIGRAKGLQKRYGKPVWITEFAINKWAYKGNVNRSLTDAYMKDVLPALEASDAVFRYAWYTARDADMLNINAGSLLVSNISDPTLTTTGTIYKAHHDSSLN